MRVKIYSMLVIYHFNQPQSFSKFLINIISTSRLADPIQPEIILVESNITARWIEFELAGYFGVMANIKFMTVESFIQNISNKILCNNLILNNFSYTSMYWRFMEILPKLHSNNNCLIIKKYLLNDLNQKKYSQLAEQLTKLFKNYIIYRPDWLNNWCWSNTTHDNNVIDKNQIWQEELWRIFLDHTKYISQELYENANTLQRCIYVLSNIQKIHCALPNRVFIFGITRIAPEYWKILELLSLRINIYLWFMGPNNNNLYNIINNVTSSSTIASKYDILKNCCANKFIYPFPHKMNFYVDCVHNDQNRLVNDNLILSEWHKVGCNILSLFNQSKDAFNIKIHDFPKKNSLLHILQRVFFELQGYELKGKQYLNVIKSRSKEKYKLKLGDNSVTFHACYNIQREVEILHDNLLSMMNDNPLLQFKEIIVMAPDICDYASAIKTVFSNMYGRQLPFFISDHYKECIHPIISAFFSILQISDSRFTSEEILSLLMVSSIASKFNIQTEEIELLRRWIMEVGIKWGLDDITMSNFDLPVINQNNWYFGLNRMLLRYAINKYDVWQGILPYSNDNINENDFNIVAQLGIFLKNLQKWRNRFLHAYTLKEWMVYFKEIIDDFFDYSNLNKEEQMALITLKKCGLYILESGIQMKFSNKIKVTVLKDQLYLRLRKKNKRSHKFTLNAINFCNISSVCFIPYKVVCFLGMNNDVFPRSEINFNFDLMVKKKCIWDYEIRDHNFYTFLLAFLLSKDLVYISFVDTSMDNRCISYPSILVSEIFEYIACNFYLEGDEHVDVEKNTWNIRRHLFKRHGRMPFDCENFNSVSKSNSFAIEWLAAAKAKASCSSLNFYNFFVNIPKFDAEIVLFYDLYKFYRHPVRMWFQNRLKVNLDQKMSLLSADEPFSVDKLDNFKLNKKLVDCLIYDNNVDDLYNKIRASGVLPYGAFGELHWIHQHKKMFILANEVRPFISHEKYDLDFSLTYNSIKLIGVLPAVQKNGLIRWKPACLSMKDCLLFWLEHLIYCAAGGSQDSRLFGTNSIWYFPNLSKLHSKELLFFYILGYYSGMSAPLFLLYNSGGAWINYVFDWKMKHISLDSIRQDKARNKLILAWQGQRIMMNNCFFSFGECSDPYLNKLIPFYLNDDHIEIIIDVAKNYLLNVMQYRII